MSQIDEIIKQIDLLPLDEKVIALNELRVKIHEISPFKSEPVDLVQWVKSETVLANSYNPNSVAKVEFDLLKLSILSDGVTQPVVTMPENGFRETIDGYHRGLTIKQDGEIRNRVFGYIPVVTINKNREDKADRMAATVRHNRARGKHAVESMSDIVIDLKKRNWNDKKIAEHLGMDADEVLRLTQITGLADIFKDREFSEAWEAEFESDDKTEILE